MRARERHNLTQDVRVRAVEAVEVPDADQGRAEISGDVVEFVKNQHEVVSSAAFK